jgi:hypothetical protein
MCFLSCEQQRHAQSVRRREKQRNNQHQQLPKRGRGTSGSSSRVTSGSSSRATSGGRSAMSSSSMGSCSMGSCSMGSSLDRIGSSRGGSSRGSSARYGSTRGNSTRGNSGSASLHLTASSTASSTASPLPNVPPRLDMAQICRVGRAAAREGQIGQLEKLSETMLQHIVSSPIKLRKGPSSRPGSKASRGSHGSSAWSSSGEGAWSKPLPKVAEGEWGAMARWEGQFQNQQKDQRQTREAATKAATSPEEANAHILSHLSNTGAVFWGDAVQAGWTLPPS